MNNQVLEYHLQVPSNDFSAEPVNGIEVSASNEEVQEEVQEEEPKANLPSLVSLWDRLKGNNFECVFAFVLFLFGILFMNKRSQRILGGGKQVGGDWGIVEVFNDIYGSFFYGEAWGNPIKEDCNTFEGNYISPSSCSFVNSVFSLLGTVGIIKCAATGVKSKI